MSGASKKRKTMTDEELKALNLSAIVTRVLGEVDLYDNFAAWAKTTTDLQGNDVYRIFDATYTDDAAAMNHFVVHPDFNRFTIARDDFGKVTKIRDPATKERIMGATLTKVMAVHYLQRNGVKSAILTQTGEKVSVLALPVLFSAKKEEVPENSKFESLATVMLHSGPIQICIPRKTLLSYLTLPYVESSYAKSIALKLNKAAKGNAIRFEKTKVEDLVNLQKSASGTDNRELKAAYEVLVSSCVSAASLEEKIEAFATDPSSHFIRELRLKKPFAGNLFGRGNNKPVQMTQLQELDDDELVLISNKIVDTKFYNGLRSAPGEFLVHQRTANVGFLKDKAWQEIKNLESMKAGDLFKMLAAIVKSNQGKPGGSRALVPEGENSDDEVDIVA